MTCRSPDNEPLLDAVLASDDLAEVRANSLQQMLATARRRQRRRRTARAVALGLTPVMCVVGLFLSLRSVAPVSRRAAAPDRASAAAQTARAPRRTSPPRPGVKVLTDDELLALFPGCAVGLIGPPGRQRLVFLR
jgi:hypothetical protein